MKTRNIQEKNFLNREHFVDKIEDWYERDVLTFALLKFLCAFSPVYSLISSAFIQFSRRNSKSK